MRLSEVTEKVIALAEAIRNYWAVELPKRHPKYPLIQASEDSGPPPPEDKELERLLKSLPEDIIYKLLLIMHLGRGDFGTDDLAGHYEALKQTFAKPEWAADQMRGKAVLADYLTEGLAELTRSGFDVDKLTFKPVRSRK